MIIEQTLEAQIIQALKTALSSGVYFSGAWQKATDGEVKGEEDGESDTVCAVTLLPRSMTEYGGGVDFVEADFSAVISVVVRGEMDATGEKVLAAWSKFAPVIWGWVKNCDSQTETALTVTDNGSVVFSPGGVQQSGGTPPTWDATVGAWSFSISFTVKGIIKE